MHTKAYSCTSRCRVSRDNLLGLVCGEELLEECKHITETVVVTLRWQRLRRVHFELIFFFLLLFQFPVDSFTDLTPNIDHKHLTGHFPFTCSLGTQTHAHITVLAAWGQI